MRVTAIATGIACLGAFGQLAAEDITRIPIANGSMTAGTEKVDGWTSVWRDPAKAEFTAVRDTTVFRTPPASLLLSSPAAVMGGTIASATTLAVGKTAEVSGFVKSEGDMKISIYYQAVDDTWKLIPPGMVKIATFEPGTTADWRPFTAKVTMPAGATKLMLGMFAAGQGKAWLDDVRNAADPEPAVK